MLLQSGTGFPLNNNFTMKEERELSLVGFYLFFPVVVLICFIWGFLVVGLAWSWFGLGLVCLLWFGLVWLV